MPVGAILGGSVLGAGASIIGSSNAADAQTNAADKANAQQAAQYQQTRGDLLPYNTAGQSALNALSYGLGTATPTIAGGSPGGSGFSSPPQSVTDLYHQLLGRDPDASGLAYFSKMPLAEAQQQIMGGQEYASRQASGASNPFATTTAATPGTTTYAGSGSGVGFGSLTKPVSMTEGEVQATPGYQFNLNQGLKAVQNSAASRGLGVSGAAMKGAASYATGLADSTYQNQFNNAVTNNTNTYNRLLGVANLGENAGATTGALGTQTATSIGNNTVGAGNASAAGDIAAGNAVGSIGNSVGNLYLTNALLKSGGGAGLFG